VIKRPQTIEELVAQRSEVVGLGNRVTIRGSGSWGAPDPNGVVLSTQRIHRILDCDVAGGLVRVEAGISIDALQQQLMYRGRWLGVDAAAINGGSPIHRTIGGLVMSDCAGLLRGLRGGWRRIVRSAVCIDPAGTRHDAVSIASLVGEAARRASKMSHAPNVNEFWLAELTLQIVPPPADERALLVFCDRLSEVRHIAQALSELSGRPGFAGVVNGTVLQHNRLMLPQTRYAVIAGFLGAHSVNVERAEALRHLLKREPGETLLLTSAQSGRLRHWVGSEPAGVTSISIQSGDPIGTMQAMEVADPAAWLTIDLLENIARGTLQIAPAVARAYLTRGETVHYLFDHRATATNGKEI
jgi:hypothetical protein